MELRPSGPSLNLLSSKTEYALFLPTSWRNEETRCSESRDRVQLMRKVVRRGGKRSYLAYPVCLLYYSIRQGKKTLPPAPLWRSSPCAKMLPPANTRNRHVWASLVSHKKLQNNYTFHKWNKIQKITRKTVSFLWSTRALNPRHTRALHKQGK